MPVADFRCHQGIGVHMIRQQRFSQDPAQGNAAYGIAYPHTGQAVGFGKSPENQKVMVFIQQCQR